MAFKKNPAEQLQEIETRKGYYFRKLPPDLQKGYDMAAEGIAGYQKKIRIPGISCKEEMEQIIHAVLLEQLQFFYFNKREIGIVQAGDQYSFAFEYLYDKKKSAQLQEQIENQADYILSQIIEEDMTDYDKCLALHDYMADNVRYNFSAAAVDYIYDAYTVEGIFLKKQAVCEGIAKGISYLLGKLGIENLIVTGFSDIDGERVAHAWNMIKQNNGYYHMDVTWDLQEINHFTNSSHMYVNLDDDAMLENHDWELENYPSCDKREENYYIKEKRFFRSIRSFELYVQKFLKENRSFMDVRFEDTLALPDDNGTYLSSIIQKNAEYVGKSFQIALVFHPGNYVLQANITY